MNGESIVTEIIGIIANPSYKKRDVILEYANQSLTALANILMLPDLKSGYDKVTTVLTDKQVGLPDTYNKGLYLAMVDGKPINIHADIKSMSITLCGVSDDEGDVKDVTVHGANLIYQAIPTTATDIDLYFYRNPLPMTDKRSSLPDGLTNNDDFDWAIIHLACRKIFDRIEDGREGPKTNTLKHEDYYNQRVLALDDYALTEGKAHSTRPSLSIPWPGAR
ncbi:MAG: hypothetical protein DRH10_00575 [Deltaproteobacteria bacterium]|nr:MAG: hypothetical protein DRH10_00575 [Deltaproteobacteria bacterium]